MQQRREPVSTIGADQTGIERDIGRDGLAKITAGRELLDQVAERDRAEPMDGLDLPAEARIVSR